MISIIIPVGSPSKILDVIRKRLSTESYPLEVLIVITKDQEGRIRPVYPFERIIVSKAKGRGYAISKGLNLAKGDISILLHADTILPSHWYEIITNTLANKNTVGGAFSLAFDTDQTYLNLLILLSDLFFKITGELWGDRAIFFRTEILKDVELLEVPIMEDVILSRFMRRIGKVVMVEHKVITSSAAFLKHGLLHHTFRIIKCRLWYALGGDLKNIYSYYYS